MAYRNRIALGSNADFYAAEGFFSLRDAAGSQAIYVRQGASVALSEVAGNNIVHLEGRSADFRIADKSGRVTIESRSAKLVLTLADGDVQTLRFHDGELPLSRSGKDIFLGTRKVAGVTAIAATPNAARTSQGMFAKDNPTFDGVSATLVDGRGDDDYNISLGATVSLSALKGANHFHLEGNKADYQISARGAFVTLTDVDGGKFGLRLSKDIQTLVFKDGSAELRFQNKSAMLGNQRLTESPSTVTTALNTAASSTDAFASISAGVVVDGYYEGATVFADANGNDALDPGEQSVTTDANGRYRLVGGMGNIVVTGGKDVSTGLPLVGMLKAAQGSSVVSQLTTVVSALNESGVALDDAEQQVKKALGIAPGVDLLEFDPIAALVNAGSDAAAAAVALKVTAANAQVNTLISMINSVLTGATGTSDGAGASDALAEALATQIKLAAGQPIDLTRADVLQSVLTDTASLAIEDAVALRKLEAQASAVVAVLSDNVENIRQAAASGSGVTALARLAQATAASSGAVADALKSAVVAGNVNVAKDTLTGSALDRLVAKTPVGLLDPASGLNGNDAIPPEDNGGAGNAGADNGGSPPAPVNQAPTEFTLLMPLTEIHENADTTTSLPVAGVYINDDGLGSNRVSLSGPDAATFEFLNNVLYLKAGSVLDYETQSNYQLTLSLQDSSLSGSAALTASYTLRLIDVDENSGGGSGSTGGDGGSTEGDGGSVSPPASTNRAPTELKLPEEPVRIHENADTSVRLFVASVAITDDGLGSNVVSL